MLLEHAPALRDDRLEKATALIMADVVESECAVRKFDRVSTRASGGFGALLLVKNQHQNSCGSVCPKKPWRYH